IDCARPFHVFYDSELGTAGDYSNNEDNTMVFCADDASKAVRLSFRMQTAPVQLDLKSTVSGNDYLRIWDGPTTTSNAKAVYTGSTNSYPQPGTVISTDQCLTVNFQSDGASTGTGWESTLRCVDAPLTNSVQTASSLAPGLFEDSGGAAGNYGNSESYFRTWCPDVNAQTAGEVIWAVFGAVEIEQNYDYLHVYDGPDANARLIGTYTGNDLDENNLQTIKASNQNATGCLTFEFYSDGATTHAGWSAVITSGQARLPYGSDNCATATLINVGGIPYAGSTTLADGRPNAADPPLNIELLSLPECSGANAITRLENTIWYRFSTPSTICSASQIDIALENISCQNSIPGGNGAQFTIYESATCQTGASWGNPVYCSDKLLSSFPVNIASLLNPSSTYYIMIDGFAGQHCNLDLILTGDLSGCILPIELVHFEGEKVEDVVELVWETAHEQRNRGFYVQRGRFGNSGELEFSDIGYVSATAGPDQGAEYHFEDREFWRDQVNYYRLRQVDVDGTSHFHRVLRVLPGENANGITAALYPNPARAQLHIDFSAAPQSAGHFRLFDLQGRIVLEESWTKGQAPRQLDLDLSTLQAGAYLYQLLLDGELQRGKVVKE
ncbi:MAG: CUB domain-containing protein, partial [Bacteroidota bacterium]